MSNDRTASDATDASGVIAQAGDRHPDNRMTAAERIELGKLIRLRVKVAKDHVEQLQARLIADSEAQLAARFDRYHESWAQAVQEAETAVKQADAQIAERCRELGVPETFRPRLTTYWIDRGENEFANRRAELRRKAYAEVEARARAAKVQIDRQAAEVLTQLTAGALGSDEARVFLTSMPTIDALMPALEFAEDLSAKAPLRLVSGGQP